LKPMFTVHEGEFLVGDYINRNLGKKHEVWVPTKDTGVDLLVTSKVRGRRPVGLQCHGSLQNRPLRVAFDCTTPSGASSSSPFGHNLPSHRHLGGGLRANRGRSGASKVAGSKAPLGGRT